MFTCHWHIAKMRLDLLRLLSDLALAPSNRRRIATQVNAAERCGLDTMTSVSVSYEERGGRPKAVRCIYIINP